MTIEHSQQTIDLDQLDWQEIKRAAAESAWMPPEYMQNDWVHDVAAWLRIGPEQAELPEDRLQMVYAVERAIASNEALVKHLLTVRDHSAEFPASDVEQLKKVLVLLRTRRESGPVRGQTEKPIKGFIKPDNDRQVFFYEQDFYVLSNFSAFTLMWKGIKFDTSEAAYHWEKFVGSGKRRSRIRHEIQQAKSAHEAFKIGERYKAHRRADSDEVKVDIMRDILRAKCSQHEYDRRKLLATGERELIEDSWRDDFWGWGPTGAGKNMLGRLWMQVRSEING